MDGDTSDEDVPSLVQPETNTKVLDDQNEEVPNLVAASSDAPQSKVPITIVTGYLGAGKQPCSTTSSPNNMERRLP
ncbi:hypothetical protein P3342_007867 [Pyrenophora teres f. teres]|nr:hypothetical protein P3342_007867 [Pyrenophora teres f. teres]